MKNSLYATAILLAAVFTAPSASFAESPDSLSALVDETLTDLLETTTLRPLVTTAFGCDSRSLQTHLGLTPPAAARVARRACRRDLTKGVIRKPALPRQYKFIYGPSSSLSGWTNGANQTAILLRAPSGDASDVLAHILNSPGARLELAQILAHETAVYLDTRQQIIPGDRQRLPWKMDPQSAVYREYLSVLTHPAVSVAMSSARAFGVEESVVAELQRNLPARYPGPIQISFGGLQRDSASCGRFVRWFLGQTYPDVQVIVRDLPWIDWSTTQFRQGSPESLESLLAPGGAAGKFLVAEVELTNGSRQSLCEFMARPQLGDSGGLTNNGPRPYITGGGSGF